MKRESAGLLIVQRNSKQEALRQAFLVPWSRLHKTVATFVGWHIFVLWVRVITEGAEQVPQIVRSELDSRCPGFLQIRQQPESPLLWKSLQEWIAEHHFAHAKAEGWFDAVMYYAYTDLCTEQAWTTWERTKADWRHAPPATWPTLERWTDEVLATRGLTHPGSEKARAVRALGAVEPSLLDEAVTYSAESRALALWADAVSEPGQPLGEAVLVELRSRHLEALPDNELWGPRLFSRLLRSADAVWRTRAKAEGWYPALRYRVFHHPRYHRFIHYNQRCHDLWSQAHPKSYPSFADWLAAADAYYVGSAP